MSNYVCYACRGIPDKEFEFRYLPEVLLSICPLCGFEYITTNDTKPSDNEDETIYYAKEDFNLRFYDMARYFKLDISVDREARWRFENIPYHATPTEQLMYVLSNVSNIVHFMTYGISKEIVGVMKLIASRAMVIGIVSNVSYAQERELRESAREVSGLHFVTYRRGTKVAPHTKLVVVDGLVAFDGSTNLTTHGLRQAEKKLDHFRIITDAQEVRKLNNEYFSSVWLKDSRSYRRLWMLKKHHDSHQVTYHFE